jgi:hypothetical protein
MQITQPADQCTKGMAVFALWLWCSCLLYVFLVNTRSGEYGVEDQLHTAAGLADVWRFSPLH